MTRIVTCSALFQELFQPPASRALETPTQAVLRKHICKFYAGHHSCTDETHDHKPVRDLIVDLQISGYSSVYFNPLLPITGHPSRPAVSVAVKRIYFKEFMGIPAFNLRFIFGQVSTCAVPNVRVKLSAARHYIEQCAKLFRTQGFVGDAKSANTLMTLYSGGRRVFSEADRVYMPIDHTSPVYTYPTYWAKTSYSHFNSRFVDLLKGRYDAEYERIVLLFRSHAALHIDFLVQRGFVPPAIPASFDPYNRGEDRRGYFLYLIMMQSFVGIALSVFAFLYHDFAFYPEYIARIEIPLRFCEPVMSRSYDFFARSAPCDVYAFIKGIIERTYVHGFATWENFLGNLLAFIDNPGTWAFSSTVQYASSVEERSSPSVNPFEYVSHDMEEDRRKKMEREALVRKVRSLSAGATRTRSTRKF